VLPILKCLYTNADQFTNKITQLIVRARDKKLDIIEITEVKHSEFLSYNLMLYSGKKIPALLY
jgi:hypothetical protein